MSLALQKIGRSLSLSHIPNTFKYTRHANSSEMLLKHSQLSESSKYTIELTQSITEFASQARISLFKAQQLDAKHAISMKAGAFQPVTTELSQQIIHNAPAVNGVVEILLATGGVLVGKAVCDGIESEEKDTASTDNSDNISLSARQSLAVSPIEGRQAQFTKLLASVLKLNPLQTPAKPENGTMSNASINLSSVLEEIVGAADINPTLIEPHHDSTIPMIGGSADYFGTQSALSGI